MIRPLVFAGLAICWAATAQAECDIGECNPRTCEDYPIQATLPGFPAHATDTTPEQRERLAKIALGVGASRSQNGGYNCAMIVGHSSSWRDISADEYDRRALERAEVVADLMASTMETMGLVPMVISKEDLDGEAFCEATGEEGFVLIYDERGNACPKVDNRTDSFSRAAREARFINRRVDMYFIPGGKRIERQIDWDKPCSDVISSGMVCVEVLDGIYQGTRCSSDSFVDFFSNSRADLLEMVENGEARLICKPDD